MAIRRCPYCKAIIDGIVEYCSNCGTQLLFPEDESKEEDIPGDKIVEEEEEEETLEATEEELEKEEPSAELEEEEEITEEKKEEVEEKEEIEITTPSLGEEIDIHDIEAMRMGEAKELVKKETQRLWESVGAGEGMKSTSVEIEMPISPEEAKSKLSETLEEELTGEQEEAMKTEGEPPSSAVPEEEEGPEIEEELQAEEKEGIEVTPPPQREEIDLRSIRLRRTPDTEKREKEEIDRFVESVKEERAAEAQPSKEEIPPSEEIEMEKSKEIDLQSIRMRKTPDTEEREKIEIERFVESIKRERERVRQNFSPGVEIPPPKEMGEETSEIKEKIPPWAEKIKEEPPLELEDKEEEKKIEEPATLEADLREEEIGTPEDKPSPPTEEPLPKEDKPPPTEKEIGLPEEVDQKVPFAREIREKRKRAMRRQRSRYYAWLKARAFDFVFIAAFSLICLWLASRLMAISLYRLISTSGPPVVVFYFVLLLFYFGFFILFLGETPGDRLFRRD